MCRQSNRCCEKEVIPSVSERLLQLILGVARNITPVTYQKGQVLFYEGHIPYGLFIIKEGEVSLTKQGTKSKDELHSCVVGFQHVLDQTPYCSTCTATTEVKAVFLSKAVVQDTMVKAEKKPL